VITLLLGAIVGVSLSAREKLKNEQSKLEQFITVTLNSQENEKQFLARELHDETAQHLVDILHKIDDVQDSVDSSNMTAHRELASLRSSVEDVLDGTRRFMLGLRPPQLDDLGLLPALQALCQDTSETTGIDVRLTYSDKVPPLPKATELAIYRIAQEALTNAGRHSRASSILLKAFCHNTTLTLSIEDDGIGSPRFPDEHLARQGKFGQIGMVERARLAGGSATIISSTGRGTKVILEVPISGR